MPLNNRNEQDSTKLKGVNLLDDPIDVEFGTFTSLSNWVQGLIFSIKKKRGVDDVPGGAQLPVSPCVSIAATGNTVLCGTDTILACGETILSVVGVSVITCGGDALEALNGNEIVCA